jgi:hypothetical protein
MKAGSAQRQPDFADISRITSLENATVLFYYQMAMKKIRMFRLKPPRRLLIEKKDQ